MATFPLPLPALTATRTTLQQADGAAKIREATLPLSARCRAPQHRMYCRVPSGAPSKQGGLAGFNSDQARALYVSPRLRRLQRVFVHDETSHTEQRMIREICKDPRKQALTVQDDTLPVTIDVAGQALLPLLLENLPGSTRQQMVHDPTLRSALGTYLCASLVVNRDRIDNVNPALFVTTSPALVTLAQGHDRHIFDEVLAQEIRSHLEILGFGWKPLLPTTVSWSDFQDVSTKMDVAATNSTAAKSCHLPLGGKQSNALTANDKVSKRGSIAAMASISPSLDIGTYTRKPKVKPMGSGKPNSKGELYEGISIVTLRADGSWAYCELASGSGAFLEAQSTPNTGPWDIQNGFLMLNRAQLQVKAVSFLDNELEFGHVLPVDPSEQAIIISLSELRDWSFQASAEDNAPPLDGLQKFIGHKMDEFRCDVPPGTYELTEPNHHVTLTLYEGASVAYQETRQFSGGCTEEITSDHRFARWRLDGETQMVHLYAPGRSGFKHRRLVRGHPVWECPLESVALPISELTGALDNGTKMSFQPMPKKSLFPEYEPVSKDVGVRNNKELSFEEFRDGLLRLNFPDGKEEAPELFRFLDAESGAGSENGVIKKEDMYSLKDYGSMAEPEWVNHLHSWLAGQPGGAEGWFDAATGLGKRKNSKQGEEEGEVTERRQSKHMSMKPAGLKKEHFVTALKEAKYPFMIRTESIFNSLDIDRAGELTKESLKVMRLFAAMNMMISVKEFHTLLGNAFASPEDASKAILSGALHVAAENNEQGGGERKSEDKSKAKEKAKAKGKGKRDSGIQIISESEWTQALEKVGISSEMCSRIFGFIDMDGSKTISVEELEHFLTDLKPQEFVTALEKFRDACITTYGSLEKTFQAMMENQPQDVQASGELTRDNWQEGCKQLDCKFPMDTCWIFTFLDVSRNHDLSLSEFMYLSAFNPTLLNGSPKRLHKFLERLFRSIDDAFQFFLEVALKRRSLEKSNVICQERMKKNNSTYVSLKNNK